MDKIPVYYQGSSIALLFRAYSKVNETRIALSEYDAEALLFTKLVGEKVKLSSAGTSEITIINVDSQTMAANIPAEITRSMPVGECSVQIMFTHKTTGVKIVATKKILILEYSVKQ